MTRTSDLGDGMSDDVCNNWWSYAIDNFVCFNMISVTVFKFDTFLVNYITLHFCQNKNISLSLFHCHCQCIC